MAEAHPVGFRWVMKAKERGAEVIHIDPRFSRTSRLADRHIPIRAGSDTAFLGAVIREVLERRAYFHEYVVHYTNAAQLVSEDFRDTEDLDGVFSGLDPRTGRYDPSSWAYAAGERDETLEHPRCVLQVLRRHFARYTPEMVERICGVSRTDLAYVVDAIVANSGRERTTSFCYALGWTQHASGAQMIRAAAILQLLMGNVGRPGGGIMALRGHASIQGSTDIPTLYDSLPGYLPMPHAGADHATLAAYNGASRARDGWWSNFDRYSVSLLKAWFGDAATPENDFGFGHLPRISGNHSHFATSLRALDGGVDGLFVMGQNPAVASQHAGLQRRSLAHLKWLVVRDLAEIETATFWRDGPEVRDGELRTEDIRTEVFLMPAASHVEKPGSFTNTNRMVQFRDKALDPPGDARSELWFVHHLFKRVRAHYAASTRARDWPIVNLRWDYPERGAAREPDVEAVLREINGYDVATGRVLDSFTDLQDDGSTASGCWIYTGVFAGGVNRARSRDPGDLDAPGGWVSPGWGFTWPANRHVIYNRASADPEGRPWSERKALVWWDEERQAWTGLDVPDFPLDKAPGYRPPADASGMAAIAGDRPFILTADGLGWLYAPTGLHDGPLPAHYEPIESPVHNALYPSQASNPVATRWSRPDNPAQATGDPRFPVVATTFRLTEHHTGGGMSRRLPWLVELQPVMFAELDPVLAADRGIEDGGWLTIVTERAQIEARARVTERLRPLRVDGRVVHQIGLPYHWGFAGPSTGDSANDLGVITGEPNVSIQESKAFTCDVRAGRRHGATTAALSTVVERAMVKPSEDDLPVENPEERP